MFQVYICLGIRQRKAIAAFDFSSRYGYVTDVVWSLKKKIYSLDIHNRVKRHYEQAGDAIKVLSVKCLKMRKMSLLGNYKPRKTIKIANLQHEHVLTPSVCKT